MACRYREELVGKRFISVRSPQKLKIQKISEWEWRSGVVRAVSSKDSSSLDLSVSIVTYVFDRLRRCQPAFLTNKVWTEFVSFLTSFHTCTFVVIPLMIDGMLRDDNLII
jgi:hypothetical protein